MEPAIKPAGALGCRAVSREGAPGGTYTSAPSSQSTLSTRSVAPSARPGTAHSTAPPPTGCVIRLGLPYLRPALHAAHVLAPTGSIPTGRHAQLWAAPIFRIRQYVIPHAQVTSLGASGPSPNTIALRHG